MFKIIHTNDIHSHLENWQSIVQFVNNRRQSYQEQHVSSLLFDVGDAIDSWHPMIEATQGKIMIELFNQLDYDGVTIGNNEGINITPRQMASLYAEANYDVVIANVLDDQYHQLPTYAKEYVLYDIDNITVAVLGLTAPYDTYHYNQYHMLNPLEVLRNVLDKLAEEKPDLIILLSHLGLNDDRYIAQAFPQINIILGAHTHHLLSEGEWVNQTLLTGCGRYGQYIGELTVHFDKATSEFEIQAQTFAMKAQEDKYIEQGETLLKEHTYPMLDKPLLPSVLSGEQSFIAYALTAIREYAEADVAVLNSGLFLDQLSAVKTNRYQLHHALPHPMHLARIVVKGYELIEILEQFMEKREALIDRPIKGLGFRGEVFGHLMLGNAVYDEKDQIWQVSGTRVRPLKNYTLVTVDHLVFLPFFTKLKEAENFELLFPELLRDIVGLKLQDIERKDVHV